MELDSLLQVLNGDSALALKNSTRFLHFIGLALGLGAATVLDLMLLRVLARKRVSEADWSFIEFGAKVVNFGLIVLWITGIAFIVQYAVFEPVKLGNEKIWAKLAIVSILTANGAFIHAVILPRLRAQIGRQLFDGMSRFQKSAFIVSGAVSATSWYTPVALGVFSQLNNAVPALVLLLVYAGLLVIMTFVMHVVMWMLTPRSEPSYAAIAYTLPEYRVEWSYGS